MSDLETSRLTVEYRSGDTTVRPLDGLDLRIEAGSTVLLLGPSGSGKTTLLSCLAGLLTPTEGTVRFGDVVISELTGAGRLRFRRSQVGIAFQAFNLVPSLTAVENVMAPLLAAGVRAKEARRRSAELLERVGLADRHQHRPGSLSGGQQQRVAVARAIAGDPPLLLADEPTAHLDQTHVEGITELLRSLRSPHRVMLIATHDPRLFPLSSETLDLGARLGTTSS
jgi:putative ABC transport system ATP-binding protein